MLAQEPEDQVDELDIRSEEERERREDHTGLIERASRRSRDTTDAAESEDLLLDAFHTAKPQKPADPEPAPEPEVAAYLPRSMRDRARRRAEH
jgi:hypothetical protein